MEATFWNIEPTAIYDDHKMRRPMPKLTRPVFVPVSEKAHQRVIREQRSVEKPRLTIPSLAGCYVASITSAEAKVIILEYEWLGTLGRAAATYGLFSASGELLGATAFGWPSAVESRDICGKELRDKAVCLERGACVHYAPPNAASFLITNAVRQAHRDKGWEIYYAYADPEAGEIGTVYQACNWLYIGQGVGRTPGRPREYWLRPDGSMVSNRTLRHKHMKIPDALALGWVRVPKHPKHKYVHFEGSHSRRKQLAKLLRYPPQPYPKRQLKQLSLVTAETA